MKHVLSERNKHRIIGVLVVLSAAVIIMPTVMRKSNQRFEENLYVSLKLQPKPALPKVAIPTSRTMFKAVKSAKIDVPKPTKVAPTAIIAKAEPLHTPPKAIQKSVIASVDHQFKTASAPVVPVKHPMVT